MLISLICCGCTWILHSLKGILFASHTVPRPRKVQNRDVDQVGYFVSPGDGDTFVG